MMDCSAYRRSIMADPRDPDPLVREHLASCHECSLYTEKLLRFQCESGGGVMVGRAAAVFLRDHPGVLRVRLDGPRDARLRQAMTIGGVDEETATRTLDRFDQAQALYARELYRANIADPAYYHLVIDSTAIDLDTCLTLILTAAEAATVAEVVAETAVSRLTERGATRADDRISEAGMEDRKRQGYF